MEVFKNFSIFSFFTIISRLFGVTRDALIASNLGAGLFADIFIIAFRLPNLFRSFFAEGSFTIVFVPMYTTKLKSIGKEAADIFANNVVFILLIILLISTVLIEIFMSSVMSIMAPGIASNENNLVLMTYAAQITFPYIAFISISVLLSGILQSKHEFITCSSLPIIVNVGLMVGSMLGIGNCIETVYILCISLIISGIVQLIVTYIVLKKYNFSINFSFNFVTQDTKIFFKKVVPSILSNSVSQINLIINTAIASTIPGAISYIYFAERLMTAPVALFGVALSTVLLPILSENVAKSDTKKINILANKGLEFILLLSIPSTFFLLTFPHYIVGIIFGHGYFNHEALEYTNKITTNIVTINTIYVCQKNFHFYIFCIW